MFFSLSLSLSLSIFSRETNASTAEPTTVSRRRNESKNRNLPSPRRRSHHHRACSLLVGSSHFSSSHHHTLFSASAIAEETSPLLHGIVSPCTVLNFPSRASAPPSVIRRRRRSLRRREAVNSHGSKSASQLSWWNFFVLKFQKQEHKKLAFWDRNFEG